ncbi:PREDICTED: protein FAR1-RELATED SEQUENCE 5-like [Ipomoea nil]|uniref:protein FAR1-RELATED SEQUENCE 5-like n=1 Tax=Ipomoea nil TaxID=35883 RepID=UPI000900DA88|nr:PREDICTED: protein FAR1-RELATED SEQUENCE 5-like [Ipomoea nil]
MAMGPEGCVQESALHLFVYCAKVAQLWHKLGWPQISYFAGWVLRDDNGVFLAAKNEDPGLYMAKEAEALSIREALSCFGFLIEDIKVLASEIVDVEFYCVKRSANSAAHIVARRPFLCQNPGVKVGCDYYRSIDGDFGTRDATHYTPGKTNTPQPTLETQRGHYNHTCTRAVFLNQYTKGFEFYKIYGGASGFDVRHSSVKRDRSGDVIRCSLVCSRQGAKGGGGRKPTLDVRGTSSSNKQRRRRVSNRVGCNAKLGLKKKSTGEFVVSKFVEDHNHSLCSEGFRLCREVAGSFENVGATYVEFHNFKRDLQTYVDVADGEMIIERFKTKREACDSFFFDYHLDEENRIARLFWADPIGRRSFSCYGDVISFDATCSTNRYNLVFVPFTGVDNHKRCITFAADPAMKIAMEQVLPGCRHRFCMWHIMTKLLMEKYNLSDHRWFKKLYAERDHWIPAFFSDLPMSGLVRTTSRSEAQNSVYGKFTRLHSSLVEFYMQTESVLDTQRHNQAKLDAQCEGSLPEFKTPLALERHAADLFTLTIFYALQKEIEAACFYCEVVGIHEDGGTIYYNIGGDCTTTHTVQYEPSGCIAFCSCKMFQRLGLICRHMFLVFKSAHIEQLPSQYIVERWRKHLGCGACRGRRSDGDPPKSGASELWSEIQTCVGMVGESMVCQARMVEVLKELRDEFASDGTIICEAKGNRAAIEALCGVQPPPCITIKPPAQAKNKGSGKRIKSTREIAIENSGKAGRKCGVCGEYARHNARSCPSKQRAL